MSTRRKLIERIRLSLTPLYGEREARSIAFTVISDLSGVSVSALLTDPEAKLTINSLDAIIERLAIGCPVQYVTGSAEFLGRRFAVGKGVLIPRPETEELVSWVAEAEIKNGDRAATESTTATKSLLDVGTGSGCIAASLALALPEARLFAADISNRALAVAAKNFHTLGADVTLRKADALSNLADVFPERFDAIVSNPPYVPQRDLAEMHVNVRDYEPHEALFVPDDDPLRFYRAIARAGQRMLCPGGRLYFEIYYLYAEQMRRMLAEEGYADIVIRDDLNAKPRMICCRLK